MSEIPDKSENNAQFEPGDRFDPQPIKPSESLPLQSARQAFNDSSAEHVMKDLIDPPVMRAMKDLIDPPVMRVMKDLIDPPAMRVMKDLIDPLAMRVMKDLIDPPAMRVMKDLIDPLAMRAMKDLIDPPAMRAVKDLIDSPAMRVMKDLIDPPAMRAMKDLIDPPAMRAVKDLIDSPAMRVMKDLIDPPAMRAMKDLIDPPAMRAMKDLIDSPAMRAMKALIDLPALRAMQDLIDSPAMRSVRAFSNARSTAVTMAFDDVLKAGTNERFDAYSLTGGPLDRLIDRSLSKAALFQSIASVEPTRLQMIARLAAQQNRADSTANSLPRDRPNVSHAKPTPTTIEAEIERALTGDAPTTPLSKEAFVVLRWIVAVLLTFYNAIAAWPDFQAGLCDFQTRLISANSLAEVRHLIQQNVCEIPRAVMKNLRYTGDEGARVYERPAIQSTMLQTLPRGVVLVVLDSSNRDWLLVHVTYDDAELEGWVSRKFTKRFVQ